MSENQWREAYFRLQDDVQTWRSRALAAESALAALRAAPFAAPTPPENKEDPTP